LWPFALSQVHVALLRRGQHHLWSSTWVVVLTRWHNICAVRSHTLSGMLMLRVKSSASVVISWMLLGREACLMDVMVKAGCSCPRFCVCVMLKRLKGPCSSTGIHVVCPEIGCLELMFEVTDAVKGQILKAKLEVVRVLSRQLQGPFPAFSRFQIIMRLSCCGCRRLDVMAAT